jgi:CoA:oxalate CoA-transferase
MNVIEQWTERHTLSECISALDRAGVPSAEYRDPGAALTDPPLLQRGAFTKLADGAGEFVGVNAPWKMSGARTTMQRDVPAAGAHRDEILSRILDLSSDSIARLVEAGAFGKPRDHTAKKK